jgi:isoleucyl-tRNA synthetase
VTLEQGTPAVHTAPGHGREDYVAAQANGIPTYCPVDAAGRFYHAEGADSEGNPLVIDPLKDAGALLSHRQTDHSYPHCWRCHNPTIFRATEQWFTGMDRSDLRQRTLEAIKKVKWTPAWAMRPDWCISRQRAEGVKCERCWKYSTWVGNDPRFPTVCGDCSAALKEMLG